MNPRYLPVGPRRDMLAILKNARRTGEWVDAHFVVDRTGWPYATAVARLGRAVADGYAEAQTTIGVRRYRGTGKGDHLL